ncbi:TPA: hypothetical protein ACGOX5_001483 [Streptococcus suis]
MENIDRQAKISIEISITSRSCGVNISAQWLIGGFVRVAHFKSDLTNVANFVRFIPNLKLSP